MRLSAGDARSDVSRRGDRAQNDSDEAAGEDDHCHQHPAAHGCLHRAYCVHSEGDDSRCDVRDGRGDAIDEWPGGGDRIPDSRRDDIDTVMQNDVSRVHRGSPVPC